MVNYDESQIHFIHKLESAKDLIGSTEIVDQNRALVELAKLALTLIAHKPYTDQLALLSDAVLGSDGYSTIIRTAEEHEVAIRNLVNERQLLEDEKQAFQNYLESAKAGTWEFDFVSGHEVFDANIYKMCGYTEEDFIGDNKPLFDSLTHPDDRALSDELMEKCRTGENEYYYCEVRVLCKDGSYKWFADRGKSFDRDEDGIAQKIMGTSIEITEQKQLEIYKKLNASILTILNKSVGISETVESVVQTIIDKTGHNAVGIRLMDGDNFPYIAQKGFPDDFITAENSLLEYDSEHEICLDDNGNAELACTCGLVLSDKTNPNSPLFTENGSFWTNNSSALLDLSAIDDPRYKPRNHCMNFGYESIALIPIRNRERIIGLIQLNSFDENCFNEEIIAQLERTAVHIGEAITRKRIAESLFESEERNRTLNEKSPIPIEYYNSDGRLVSVNTACLRMFGIEDKDSITGFKLFDDPNITEDNKNDLRNGLPIRYEAPFDFDLVKSM